MVGRTFSRFLIGKKAFWIRCFCFIYAGEAQGAEMWNDNVNDAWKVIAQLEHAQDRQAFQSAVRAAQEYMKLLDVNSQSMMELDRKAYCLSNEYSDKDTKARMLEAKSRVIEHIKKTMDDCQRNDLLLNVLENY